MSTLQAATQNLRKYFWPLLCVQLPAASINPLQDLTEAWTEAHPFFGALLFIPYLFLTSYISSAGTFCILDRNADWKTAPKSPLAQWRTSWSKLGDRRDHSLGFAVILP
ncbi:MAG: hypothetical protein H6617_08565 [Bdellovibrionaceae bacterium]|nr:hypothetical protein [Pseudobdellovibrionaceae bacterium]